MTAFYTTLLVCFGVVVVFLGIAGVLRQSFPASGPMIAAVIGIAAGPYGLDLIALHNLTSDPPRLLEELARITLALTVMSTALRIPGYSWRLIRAAGVMLAVMMPLMWMTNSVLTAAVFGSAAPLALLLGAILAPTDPVLSSSIVSGDLAMKNVPPRLRHLISAEAGANDGLGLLLVSAPILWLSKPPGAAVAEWLVDVVAWDVLIAAVIGWIIGDQIGRAFRHAQSKGLTRNVSVFAVTIALALCVLSLGRVLKSDGILSVFFAGLAFSRIAKPQMQKQAERTQEAARALFEIPVFVLFGVAAPLNEWGELGTGAAAFVMLLLALRRAPWIFLAAPATGFFRNWREKLFVGWFGPIGVAAIFYCLLAERRLPDAELWPIVSLTVMASTVVHGVSANPATSKLGADRRARRQHPPAEEAFAHV